MEFIHSIMKDAIPQVVKGLPIPRTVRWAFGVQGRIQEKLHAGVDEHKDLFRVAQSFRHIGQVIYYDNQFSQPVSYWDKGFHYSKPKNNTENLFYDIKYKQSNDGFKAATDNHLFLVRGPGLAYGVEQPRTS